MTLPRCPGRVLRGTLAAALLFTLPTVASPQDATGRAAPIVRDAVATDFLPALHTIRPVPPRIDGVRVLPRKTLPGRIDSTPPAGVTESLVQEVPVPGVLASLGVGFDGVSNVNGVLPPDPTGAVGPAHYVQAVNLSFAIYDRTGTTLYGPADLNTLWTNFGGACESSNDGDPVVLYDRAADRFVISQFALPNFPAGPFYECIAVTQSSDPTQGWHRYAFLVSNTKMNDYPKLAVWPDGYYMTVNQFAQSSLRWAGAGVVAFERQRMLNPALGTPRMVYFDLYSVNPNLGGMLPSDWDGATAPPAGAPNVFAEIDDDAWGYTASDQIWLWSFHVDWTNPNLSTFTSLATLPTSPFDANLCNYSRSCIPQPGTSVKLDAISDRAMFRMPYRRLSSGTAHESLVLNHTVDVNGSDRAGIRWYELRKSGAGWTLYQQGTWAPSDALHRWMGSIAMNDAGAIALAYSVSGTSVSPSLRFTSRNPGDPLGTMSQPETSIVDGSGAQTHSASRWGDYSHMSADPIDGNTLWYTGEYTNSVSLAAWRTRITQLGLTTNPPPPRELVHVGDLDGSTSTVRKAWRASVVIAVHDSGHSPVSAATVSAVWSGAATGGVSCVTDAAGVCTVSTGNLNTKKTQVTLTISAISHASASFDAGSNHDPDGDSSGTVISVTRP